MVWQLVVLPGTHTVTVVNNVLVSALVVGSGPASTTTLTTLEPVDGGVPPPEDELPESTPASLPPQESTAMHRTAQNPKRAARACAPVIANLAISANLQR